jgi:predicted RNA binding protein YcfA (HicA-like mRNA interferase family)
MPKKIRTLIHDLKKAGFVDRGGKGSHRNFTHVRGVRITLSGNPSQDAKRYQERDVEKAVREVAE